MEDFERPPIKEDNLDAWAADEIRSFCPNFTLKILIGDFSKVGRTVMTSPVTTEYLIPRDFQALSNLILL